MSWHLCSPAPTYRTMEEAPTVAPQHPPPGWFARLFGCGIQPVYQPAPFVSPVRRHSKP